MPPTRDEVSDHPFVAWLRRNAPDAPFCVVDEDAARDFHTRNPDLQELELDDRLRATLAPDHVLYDSGGASGRIMSGSNYWTIGVQASGTSPPVLTLFLVDD